VRRHRVRTSAAVDGCVRAHGWNVECRTIGVRFSSLIQSVRVWRAQPKVGKVAAKKITAFKFKTHFVKLRDSFYNPFILCHADASHVRVRQPTGRDASQPCATAHLRLGQGCALSCQSSDARADPGRCRGRRSASHAGLCLLRRAVPMGAEEQLSLKRGDRRRRLRMEDIWMF
jgi:hypothetical protein